MKKLTKMMIVSCIACAMTAVAMADGFMNICELAQDNSVGVILNESGSFASGPVTKLFDGDLTSPWYPTANTYIEENNDEIWEYNQNTAWFEFHIPTTWAEDKVVIPTGFEIHHVAGQKSPPVRFAVFALNETSQEWVKLDARDVGVYFKSNSSLYFDLPANPDGTHTPYRSFRFEGYKTLASDHNWMSISEIKIYGYVGSPSATTYGKLTVVSPIIDGLNISPGTHHFAPIPAQSIDATASSMVTVGETTYAFTGYTIEESADGGATWSEAVTYTELPRYTYTPREGIEERITWLYDIREAIPLEVYVDPVNGSDTAKGDATHPIQSLEQAQKMIQYGSTIHLLAGVHTIANEIVFDNLSGFTIEGDNAQTTFIEPAESVSSRILNVRNSSNITFKNLTFQKARVVSSCVNEMGGAVLVQSSFGIQFDECHFENNAIDSTENHAMGGGLAVSNAFVSVCNSRFDGNWARTSVSKPNAIGGALAVVTSVNGASGVACTNTVFMQNGIKGTDGAALYFGHQTKSDLKNCLIAYNDGFDQNGVMAQSAIACSTIQPAGMASGNMGNQTVVMTDSTVAYNLTNHAIADQYDDFLGVNSIFQGHHAMAVHDLTHGKTTFKNCLYDKSFTIDGYYMTSYNYINVENCTRGYATFNPDFSQSESSLGYGKGYTPTVQSAIVPRTLYVNSSVSANGDGTFANPYKTLTSAIADANDGDTIQLAEGTYDSNNETFPIILDSRRMLKIQGAGSDKTFFKPGSGADQISSLFILTNSFAITLKGFGIRNFETTVASADPLVMKLDTCVCVLVQDVKIENCSKVLETSVTLNGGLIGVRHTQSYQFDRCVIKGNTVAMPNGTIKGGVGGFFKSFGIVSNCEIRDNEFAGGSLNALGFYYDVQSAGSGWNTKSLGLIRNSLVANNRYSDSGKKGTINGGVLNANWGTIMIENCTFYCGENQPLAMYYTHLLMKNSIIANCGMGINYTVGGVSTMQSYSHLSANLFETNDVCLASNYSTKTGRANNGNGLNDDPCGPYYYTDDVGFRNREKGNFTLKRESPAVNLAIARSWMGVNRDYSVNADVLDPSCVSWNPNETPALDLAGNPRVVGIAADIGCYELQKADGFRIIVR